ncbi:hypothetical protein BGY98DRAFT_932994 [Russula aff. rugulosa BPL654]|nr:hypothetical protein BGY98DRAFT_932994 [Russula aff. rugulosa BPL654]
MSRVSWKGHILMGVSTPCCLRWFCNAIVHGSVCGYTEILDQLETSYILVGSLIALDAPRKINWYLWNARREDASLEQIRAVRQMAMCASQSAGVMRRNEIPEVME